VNYEDVRDAIRFMRRGVVIRTVINAFTFDGATKDAMRQAVRDALISPSIRACATSISSLIRRAMGRSCWICRLLSTARAFRQ
jgi:hypothetical protein